MELTLALSVGMAGCVAAGHLKLCLQAALPPTLWLGSTIPAPMLLQVPRCCAPSAGCGRWEWSKWRPEMRTPLPCWWMADCSPG